LCTGTPEATARAIAPTTPAASVASWARAAASAGSVTARATRRPARADVRTDHSVVCHQAEAATRARPGSASIAGVSCSGRA
jgi:surface antigen